MFNENGMFGEILTLFSRMELLFIVLFAYLKNLKKQKLSKVVDTAAAKAQSSLPATLK